MNAYLPEDPKELKDIALIRKRLAGTDRDDHVAIVDDWEKRVRKALIFENFGKHEGVRMLIERAEQELREIDEALRLGRPKDLSDDEIRRFAAETLNIHNRRAVWEWFIGLFRENGDDLVELRAEIQREFAEDEELAAMREEEETPDDPGEELPE